MLLPLILCFLFYFVLFFNFWILHIWEFGYIFQNLLLTRFLNFLMNILNRFLANKKVIKICAGISSSIYCSKRRHNSLAAVFPWSECEPLQHLKKNWKKNKKGKERKIRNKYGMVAKDSESEKEGQKNPLEIIYPCWS